ncbi:hypothetical protein HYX07_00960 [Candidatus Woesearchaeota archaeon]|nr:hypothetical protein [Candidatus Woesearchaeota archaeon]
MEGQIVQLRERYGEQHDYPALTEQQRALLLASDIKDNTDGCGQRTVHVGGISQEAGTTLLDILDSHNYVFHGNGPGGSGDYAIARIPVFKRALGIARNLRDVGPRNVGGQTYLFELPDSKVEVRYATVKDRV